jgi:hypothetical protein
MTDEIEFTPDEWLKVIADTADDARKFFGAPPNWPVKFDGFMEHRKGRVWRVLATGLQVK